MVGGDVCSCPYVLTPVFWLSTQGREENGAMGRRHWLTILEQCLLRLLLKYN